jgi:PAS domain S-box-containing protein
MADSVKILYAEDTPSDAELTTRELTRQGLAHDCTVSADLGELEGLLKRGGFDIFLSDFSLKKFSAEDLLRLRNRLAPELPFIIVTGTLPDEQAVELLRTGATDYIIKDRLSRLPAAIIRALAEKVEKRKLDRARRDTEESEARYRELFECSTDLLFLVSLDGGITISNPAFRALTGRNPAELATLRAEVLVPAAERGRFSARLAAAAAGEPPQQFETVFVSSSGKEMTVQGAFYQRGAGGRILYLQGIFRDITEQRALEVQFRQSQKMEAVGRLAGGIAHDFNNILGAIEGYATLGMRKLAETDPLWGDLGEIRRAVAKASALTKQLLVFSRKQAIRKEPVCPAALIENLRGMVKRIIGENIELKVEVAPGLPQTMADPGQLEQLLLNLFVNARDAMPGGGTISVKAEAVKREGHEARSPNPETAGALFIKITVSDTGTGMSTQVMEHLFEPFFTTKEKGKGTGLGLSTVYGIARQHNGWLEVRTAEGKGSEFSFFLPAGALAPAAPSPAPLPAAPAAHGNGASVLIVEDDEDLCRMAAKALDAAGFEVKYAYGTAEGLSLFRAAEGKFDLVFCDVLLKDGTATEMAAAMRELNPRARFIFASGYVQPGPVMDAIERLGCGFLIKPYAIDALLAAIGDCLKEQKKP